MVEKLLKGTDLGKTQAGPSVGIDTARKAMMVENFHRHMVGMQPQDKMAVLMVSMAKTLDEIVVAGSPRGKIINAACDDFRKIMQANVLKT